ncbi:CatB-related O-acetyltransferase [Pseudomonas helleri]|uniref:CatB-related O-acetyltransferase n=1 Tax=Pseudomonas helleri TaxID=1608996 RepID=UPI003F960DB7
MKRKIEGFSAHWSSYADKSSSFEGYNNIGRRCIIISSSISRFTYVSADTKIVRARIGSFCSIAQEVLIGGLASHPLDWLSTHPVFYSTKKQANYSFASSDQINEQGIVEIGHDVWIGARAMILDNCKIGNGAVIAAGAVVVKDVPPYAIVGGVPARIIKYRFSDEKIEKIQQSKWWEQDIQALSKLNTRKPLSEQQI